MRRMILTSLVLLPVMAQAQARTSSEPQPSTSSAMVAGLTQPAMPAGLALAAASKPAAIPATGTANHAAIREFVKTQTMDNFADAALMKGGTVEYAMNSNAPTEFAGPTVTKAVEVGLSTQELAEQPSVSNVVIHAIVDVNGVPRNVSVAKSAGSVIDRKAIEAVSQYRFKPATLDNKPTWATVSIAIKIEKP
jgi:TonB family protein